WMAGRFAGGITPLLVFALIEQAEVGWRHIFWIFGVVGVGWCVLFWIWYRDRPEDKPGVNPAEVEWIQSGQRQEESHHGVPWMSILTSGNLWVLCLMYFCSAYGWYFNITWLPKFLNEQYGVSKETHGFWTMSLLAGAPLLLGSIACLFG